MTVEESKINDANNLVPDGVIALVVEDPRFERAIPDIIEPLKKKPRREWFTSHFYYCLPLVIGNQYGFVIKSYNDWTAEWDGSIGNDAVKINIHSQDPDANQSVKSHFGSGIVTVQNRFHFRTPLGVNLMTMNPPNFLLPHMQNLQGVIETDNLRRDFTFNIKITTPNVRIEVKKGQPIAALLPIPRYFPEKFELRLAREIFSESALRSEYDMVKRFSDERSGPDKAKPHQAGRRYFNGEDAAGCPFPDHQKKM